MPHLKLPSFLRQLLGALGGAAVALMLYEAYAVSAPTVTAWLTAPQSQVAAEHPGAVRANRQLDDYKLKRVTARAKEIYDRFAAEKGPQAAILPKGIEVTQPSEQQSSAIAFVDTTASSSGVIPVQESVAYVVPSGANASSPSSGDRRVAAPVATVARDRRAIAKLADTRLPQSGIGTALVAMAALGMTTVMRRRR